MWWMQRVSRVSKEACGTVSVQSRLHDRACQISPIVFAKCHQKCLSYAAGNLAKTYSAGFVNNSREKYMKHLRNTLMLCLYKQSLKIKYQNTESCFTRCKLNTAFYFFTFVLKIM